MRRTSLTPAQAKKLGTALRKQRKDKGLSTRQLEATSGVTIGSIVMLEHGDILSPQPNTITELANALDLSVTDLFTLIGWLPANELPTLKPYLRAKYHELDEQALADLERYAEELTRRHGATGPVDHEDEAS